MNILELEEIIIDLKCGERFSLPKSLSAKKAHGMVATIGAMHGMCFWVLSNGYIVRKV